MSVPRTAACPKGWFPPATFQLRLRSLRNIQYIAPSSCGGKSSGHIHLTLHTDSDSPSVWTSSRLKWSCDKDEKLEWSDIEIDPRHVNLGLKSIVIRAWFSHQSVDDEVLTTWGLYFSGLWCLGTHPPNQGRLPPNSLVLQLCGSYFSSLAHIRDVSNEIPRFLHIGTLEEYQTVKSYDTTLLSKLHMKQRALKQQDTNNTRLISDLRSKGVGRTNVSFQESLEKPKEIKATEEVPLINPGALPSLRQTLLVRKCKQPSTRTAEQNLLARIELSRIRIGLLQKERERQKKSIDAIRQNYKALIHQMEEKSSSQMDSYYNLSKEKTALQTWMEQFKVDKLTNESWNTVLRQERLTILNSLLDVFPIGDLGGKRPSLRWVCLPPTDEIRESIRDDTHISVVIGDVAHFIYVVSRVLDLPLRYPIHLMGSTSFIQDKVLVIPENEIKRDLVLANEKFPLHLRKNSNASEWSKFEYALHLLNKNVAQIRWSCGLVTSDLRPTLHNLHELVTMGKGNIRCTADLMPPTLTRATPPTFLKNAAPQVIIKNGRVAMAPPITVEAAAIAGMRKYSRCSDQDGLLSAPQVSDAESDGVHSYEDQPLSSSAGTSHSSTSLEMMDGAVPDPPAEEITDDSLLSAIDSTTEATSLEADGANLFWNEVTSRAKALSNPSSFQRPRAHHL